MKQISIQYLAPLVLFFMFIPSAFAGGSTAGVYETNITDKYLSAGTDDQFLMSFTVEPWDTFPGDLTVESLDITCAPSHGFTTLKLMNEETELANTAFESGTIAGTQSAHIGSSDHILPNGTTTELTLLVSVEENTGDFITACAIDDLFLSKTDQDFVFSAEAQVIDFDVSKLVYVDDPSSENQVENYKVFNTYYNDSDLGLGTKNEFLMEFDVNATKDTELQDAFIYCAGGDVIQNYRLEVNGEIFHPAAMQNNWYTNSRPEHSWNDRIVFSDLGLVTGIGEGLHFKLYGNTYNYFSHVEGKGVQCSVLDIMAVDAPEGDLYKWDYIDLHEEETEPVNPDMPDVYLENFYFNECPQMAYHVSDRELGTTEILNVADDGTYFDSLPSPNEYVQYTRDIRRTLCVTYTFGLEKDIPLGDKYEIWESFYTTDKDDTYKSLNSGHIAWEPLEPGEIFTENNSYEVNINKYGNEDICIGLDVELHDKDLINSTQTETAQVDDGNPNNNSAKLCFNVKEYTFPDKPANLRATNVEGWNLGLEWDQVAGAEQYEIRVSDYAPNTGFDDDILEKVTVNNTQLEFPTDHLYCLTIVAKKGKIIGPPSEQFCFSGAMRLFKDVPVSSWYFPYMHELQANGIINGYKDPKGNDLGTFGPADNLTVAESLKMAFTGIWRSKVVLTEDSPKLPTRLKDHWAAEYLQKGIIKDLTIIKDLENFNPDRPITRAELLQVLVEVEGSKVPHYEKYSATDITNSKYADIIQYCYGLGVVNGYNDGTFKPDSLLNRAEFTKILSNFR